MSNKCILCGKDRVVIKTYQKREGGSLVTYRETGCPNPECQKKVNTDLKNEAIKRTRIKEEQTRREEERKKRNSIKL